MKRIAVVASCLLFVACRNTELPSEAALAQPGGGPQVSAPTLVNQRVVLNNSVTLNVEDVNQIASVNLSCGSDANPAAIDLMSWNSPPFVGFVNFTPCTAVGAPSDAGVGLLDVLLTVVAQDKAGNSSTTNFTIHLDTSTPGITLAAPARVVPDGPVDFTLTVDRDLRGLPVVRIGGLDAQVTELDTRTFAVHLAALPPMGLAASDGGVTEAALEDIARSFTISVDAVGSNGNVGHTEQPLLVSRVLWTQSLPGPLTSFGLQDPYPAYGALAGPSSLTLAFGYIEGWQPGWYLDDGSFVGAPPLAAFTDMYSAMDQAGNVYITSGLAALRGGGVSASVATASTATATDTPITLPGNGVYTLSPTAPQTPVATGLTNVPSGQSLVGNELCVPNYWCGSGPALVNCIDAAGTQTSLSSTQELATWSYSVASGSALLQVGVGECDAGVITGRVGFAAGDTKTGSFTATYDFDAGTLGDCTYSGAMDGWPVGDGRSAIIAGVTCTDALLNVTSGTSAMLVDQNANVLGDYFDEATATPMIVGMLPDARMLALEPGALSTQIVAYATDQTVTPIATLPGVFAFNAVPTPNGPQAVPNLIPRSVVQQPDRIAFLAYTDSRSAAVVVLDTAGQPQWVYRYPYAIDALQTGASPTLVGNPSGGALYLVDGYNAKVTALEP